MHPLQSYYIRQAGGGGSNTAIGPIYSIPPYLQRGRGIGNVLGSLFRFIKPILWSGAKALGRETLRTDIAKNRTSTSPVEVRDIVSRRLSESRQKLIDTLEGRGRKRAPTPKNKRPKTKRARIVMRGRGRKRAAPAPKNKRGRKTKRAKIIKRDIFS